jgi:hypothetical protein
MLRSMKRNIMLAKSVEEGFYEHSSLSTYEMETAHIVLCLSMQKKI